MIKISEILLVQPNYEGWTGFPLGLATISTYLNFQGHKTTIIDLTYEQINNPKFEDIYNVPEYVALTCTTPTYHSALDLAKNIKQTNPDTKIIMGGPHVSYTPEQTLKHDFVDIVVMGEGLKTIKEIISSKKLSDIKGLSYKDESKKIILNKPRELIQDLNSIPFADRKYAEKYSIEHFSKRKKSTTMMTSLGCNENCNFCSASNYWGNIRQRSINNVIEEIKILETAGYRNIYFEDDNFVFNKTRASNLAKKIKPIDIDWHIETRVDTINAELLETMADCGLKSIFFGIESGNKQILKNMGKNTTPEKGFESFKLCKDVGIETLAAIQIGFPGETDETLRETIAYLHHLEPNKILPAITSLYPGTPLFRKLGLPLEVYENPIESKELREWKVEHNNHGAGSIHPEYITGIPTGEYSNPDIGVINFKKSNDILEKISRTYDILKDTFGSQIEHPR